VAVAVLALTQPVNTFVALQHPVGLPIFGLGVASVLLYRDRLQARQRTAAIPAAHDDRPVDNQPGDEQSGDDQAAGAS
jgi:hypothetical protein